MECEGTKPAQTLAQIKAEQRKLDSLKNMGVPWVFVQPTRLYNVKTSRIHKKKHNKQEAFQKLGAEEIAFLGDSKVPLSDEEIELLLNSYQNNYKIPSPPESKLPRLITKQSTKPEIPVPLISSPKKHWSDDEDLFSVRSSISIDPLDACEDTESTPLLHEKDEETKDDTASLEEIKQYLKRDIENSHLEKKEYPVEKIKLFPLASLPSKCNSEKTTEKLTEGQKRIRKAVQAVSDLTNCGSAIRQVEHTYKAQRDQNMEKLSQCVGTLHFKQYLEKNNQKLPPMLAGLQFKGNGMPKQRSKSMFQLKTSK